MVDVAVDGLRIPESMWKYCLLRSHFLYPVSSWATSLSSRLLFPREGAGHGWPVLGTFWWSKQPQTSPKPHPQRCFPYSSGLSTPPACPTSLTLLHPCLLRTYSFLKSLSKSNHLAKVFSDPPPQSSLISHSLFPHDMFSHFYLNTEYMPLWVLDYSDISSFTTRL